MCVCVCSSHIDDYTVCLSVTQINFFQDYTKVIVCPLMQAVSYIDEGRGFCTFKLKAIEQVCSYCVRALTSDLSCVPVQSHDSHVTWPPLSVTLTFDCSLDVGRS